MADLPPTMRRLVAPRKTTPEGFELQQVPTPTACGPTQVIMKVHAAGMNTGDVQIASGKLAIFHTPTYAPHRCLHETHWPIVF
jgi:NADPH:quinone reductase-like Zn-dependent oxidoreductase